MNKDECKQPERLQKDAKKGKLEGEVASAANITASITASITAFVHHLLSEDEPTKKLIRDIWKDALKKAPKKTAMQRQKSLMQMATSIKAKQTKSAMTTYRPTTVLL